MEDKTELDFTAGAMGVLLFSYGLFGLKVNHEWSDSVVGYRIIFSSPLIFITYRHTNPMMAGKAIGRLAMPKNKSI